MTPATANARPTDCARTLTVLTASWNRASSSASSSTARSTLARSSDSDRDAVSTQARTVDIEYRFEHRQHQVSRAHLVPELLHPVFEPCSHVLANQPGEQVEDLLQLAQPEAQHPADLGQRLDLLAELAHRLGHIFRNQLAQLLEHARDHLTGARHDESQQVVCGATKGFLGKYTGRRFR